MKTEQEMIKAWKENKEAFGLMDKEMQDWARDVGVKNFDCYMKGDNLQHKDISGWGTRDRFYSDDAYRLRQDYQTEVIEIEIRHDSILNQERLALYYGANGFGVYTNAPAICPKDGFRFIGYKYEGMDNLYLEPAIYITPSGAKRGFKTLNDDCDVIFPTHAVYKKV